VGTPLSVVAPGVLANDTDADNNPLTAGPASDPANGSVSLNANGSFIYTPDTGFTGSDTFTYTVADNQGGSDTGLVTIAVNPPPGPTTLTVGDLWFAEGNTGTTAATFTVTRSGDDSGSSTVKYKTSGGTATAGTDYSGPVPLSTLSFGPLETTKTVTVDVAGDTAPEKDETFNLVLSAPTGAVIGDASATATIVNDDGSAFLAVDSLTVNEGGTAAFTITRSGNTDGTSTAKYRTNGGTAVPGTDYSSVALTDVTFGPGQSTATVNVATTSDATDEKNETFNLVLSVPSAGTVLADASGAATIVDDDGPVTAGPSTYLSVGNVLVTEGNSGTTAATFTVTRSNTSGAPTVKVRTSGGTATAGTDYTSVPLTVVSFAPGEATTTVSVDVAGDNVPEKDETFNLMLSAATGATIADASATATILNDDAPAYLTVGNVSVTEGNGGTTTATFTITRSGNLNGESTVKYKTSGGTAIAGTDYTAVALNSVTFAAGETTKTVSVDVTGDTTLEKNETFNLVLSAATGATISDASGSATIVNDDVAP
jgi:hypothetical protein